MYRTLRNEIHSSDVPPVADSAPPARNVRLVPQADITIEGSLWRRPPTEPARRASAMAGPLRGASCRCQNNYENTRWSACAWRPTACNWRATPATPMCSRTSLGWHGSGPAWRSLARARMSAGSLPVVKRGRHDRWHTFPTCHPDRRR